MSRETPPREDQTTAKPERVRSVLIVDDDESLCELIQKQLRRQGYDGQSATSGQKAKDALRERDFDVVVSDIQLGDMSGLALCEWVAANRSDVPVIMITAFGSLQTAVGAIRAGAYDFITKPVDIELLRFTIDRAFQHKSLSEEVQRLRREARPSRLDGIVGESPPMKRLADLVSRVSESDATVLISGESGTGKELVARALHAQSKRSQGPFVPVNCAALQSTLLESELFGHLKGAFTDARSSREGLMRQASGGTLFLDEIAEMSQEMQVKLLRALQERKVRPVGGQEELPFDVRIVAATNKDIETEVEEGRFREDLYYRINVVRIFVPPLKARGNDVLLLAQHFLNRICKRSGKDIQGIAAPAAQMLVNFDWPGNVRQLENVMERAVALARYEQIVADDLPERIRDYRSNQMVIAGDDPDELIPLDELERRYIQKVLESVKGNKTQAARILGLDRRTLYRKLDRYDAAERRAAQ